MAINALRALSLSPWRIIVYVEAWDSTLLTPEKWRITRSGGSPTRVAFAWQVGDTVVELAMEEPLTPEVVHSVEVPSLGLGPIAVAYHDPAHLTELGDDLFAADDPEGEAYGVDWDWCGENTDVTGDVPEVRGVACLRHDLAAVAMTTRGELPHRPTTGLGLRERVNGPGSPARLLELQGEVRRAYLEDDRVAGAEVAVSADGSGVTVIRANVSARPVGGDPLSLTVPLTR